MVVVAEAQALGGQPGRHAVQLRRHRAHAVAVGEAAGGRYGTITVSAPSVRAAAATGARPARRPARRARCTPPGATYGRSHGHGTPGFLVSLVIYFAILGMQSIGPSLPFGLALGASRGLSAPAQRWLVWPWPWYPAFVLPRHRRSSGPRAARGCP